MKKFILFISLISITFSNAQSSWKKIDSKSYTNNKNKTIKRKNQPKKYSLYSLDLDGFKSELSSQKTIKMPNSKGGVSNFYVEETSNFTNTLAKQYGYIKSFNLKGIDDKTAKGKISIGNDGVYVTIYSIKHSTFYIDPYTKDKSTFIAYERKNLEARKEGVECLVEDQGFRKQPVKSFHFRNADDGKLRTYRLALACTGEYAQFHINQQGVNSNASDDVKKAAVLSAMNTTITRVNGVYERELAVKMNIVVNSNGVNELIYLNANSDPFTNDSASILIEESQSTCDSVIGNANYDIGHTFSTGAGGLAGVGVICSNTRKAKGVTGTSNPINDAYDIDFVAHEIGHQFGAPHTFNNSCSGNRSDNNAVEPGSGSTIMAYAGICSPNVQNASNDYFHSVSIASMWSVIQSTSCPTLTNTNNVAPNAIAGSDVSVPKSTPLILRGQATDTDSPNSLTYCWEQIDTEIATQPPVATNTGGPTFRSLPPTESPDRYLPALSTVIGGSTSSTWEVIPSVAREMNFSLTVRDNHSGGGAGARDDIKITVTDAEPFTITSQNTAVTWSTGSNQTITWNKSTTDQAPINCTNVKIKLSTDGGLTFPITLVESTPNDGSHEISVPNHPTTNARIMIEAIGNIFYNVNSTNFTINSTVPTFLMSNNTNSQSVCNNTSNVATYTFSVEFLNGFNETVSFSATNLPNGSTATFSPTAINSNGNVTMTVNGLSGSNAQNYIINVTGAANSISQNADANLTVLGTNFSQLALTSPANESTNVSLSPTLQWGNDSNATSYDIQVASDINFTNLIVNNATSNTNSFTIPNTLNPTTTYYWRVKQKNNCGEGTFSSTSSFTTKAPSYCSSTFTESNNSEYISNVTFNTINNNSGNDHSPTADDGYEDFTSISTNVKRTQSYEVSVSFDVAGFQDHCYVFIDWNKDYVFDIDTERYDLGNLTNDSSETSKTFNITVPDNATIGETRMRVVVEYYGNNSPHGVGACDSDHKSEWGETEDYTVIVEEAPSADFTITSISDQLSICNKATNEQTFELDFKTLFGFNENVTLSASGIPTNSTATFLPNTINADGRINFTLSNLNNAPAGDYTIIVTATSSSITKTAEILFNINDDICNSSGNTNSQISTTLVNIGNINNTSTKTNGYSDFKSISSELIKGQTYPLNVNVNTDGNNTTKTTAWIDWNQNCLFEDNEKYDLGTISNGNGATSNSGLEITVPNDALTGNTTLRVSTKSTSNGDPIACQLDFNGEVEDYTIILTPTYEITNNTGNSSVCNSAINEVTYSFNYKTFNDFSENVNLAVANLPANATANLSQTTINSDGTITLTISGLNSVAVGEYNLTLNATSNTVNKSLDFILAVNNGLCISRGNTDSQISTTLVNFGEIDNSSTKTNGYSDFTSISTGVVRGESYSLTVNANSDGNNTVNTYAWIDWNQNCVFDTNELFNLGNVTNGNTATSASGLSITVPENAPLGSTTLRVLTELSSNLTADSCRLDFNGETEDYTIIVEESFATDATLFTDLNVYPVPSDGKINLNFKVKDKNSVIIKLYDLRGRLINSYNYSTISSLFAREIDLGKLSSELYILEIENAGRKTTKKIIIR